MKQSNRSSTFPVLVGVIAFIVGLVIGLVVLGWLVFPVTWTGGTIELLNPADQQDYLRAAIDSFTVNHSADLAQNRYAALGPTKEVMLYDIYSAGGSNQPAIEEFAAAVGATQVLAGEFVAPTPTPQASSGLGPAGGRPLWFYLCILAAFLLLVALLIVLLVVRSRSRRSKSQAGATIKTYDNPELASEQPGPQETQEAVYPAAGLAGEKTGQDLFAAEGEQPPLEPGDLPDWLQSTQEGAQGFQDLSPHPEETAELSDQDIAEISSGGYSFLQDEEVAPEFGEELQAAQPDGTLPAPVPVGEETSEQTYAKFSGDLQSIPSIAGEEAQKLKKMGINAPLLVLRHGATPQGRQEIAEKTGIDNTKIIAWVNYADLLRVKGLSHEDAQVLNTIGVNTLADLARQDPGALYEEIQEAIAANVRFFRQPPAIEWVENWVDQANRLPPVVTL